MCVRHHMCVFMCHGRQPLTHHPRPHTMGKHRERRSAEKKEEKQKKSDVGGRRNTLVPHMRASDLWEGSFVLKGTTPSLPSHLCQTSPSLCHSGPGFALRIQGRKRERKKRKSQKNDRTHSPACSTWSSAQVQAEFLVPGEAPRQRPYPNLYGKASSNSAAACTGQHTAGMSTRICVCMCAGNAPHLSAVCEAEGTRLQAWSGWWGWGGGALQRGSNVRGVLPQCRAAHGAHTLLRLEGRETNRRAWKMKKKKFAAASN